MKKKILLISSSVIMLCVCIIAGMSYALFSDAVSVSNHLKAGNLKITLARTNLEYSTLNDDGELETHTDTTRLALTNTTTQDTNVFGLDADDLRIVPGSYFEATLEIANAGNTAFDYGVSIKLNGTSNALAEQLKVTVTRPGSTQSESKMLSELAGGLSISTGSMKAGDSAQSFTVRVEFVDSADYDRENPEADPMNNNAAQDLTALFDLVVAAVQATS